MARHHQHVSSVAPRRLINTQIGRNNLEATMMMDTRSCEKVFAETRGGRLRPDHPGRRRRDRSVPSLSINDKQSLVVYCQREYDSMRFDELLRTLDRSKADGTTARAVIIVIDVKRKDNYLLHLTPNPTRTNEV